MKKTKKIKYSKKSGNKTLLPYLMAAKESVVFPLEQSTKKLSPFSIWDAFSFDLGEAVTLLSSQ